MAERDYEQIFDGLWDLARVKCIKWAGLANGDTGKPYKLPHYADRSVQVAGTPGVGGKVQIKGSNAIKNAAGELLDTPVYDVLSDTRNGLLEFTAAGGLRQIVEVCHAVRPKVPSGDGTTSWDVYLYIIFRK
jgi:hypothetical protein